MKRIAAMLAGVLAILLVQPAQAWGLTLIAPIPGPVVRRFDAPNPDWQAGHRGVDLLGSPGEPVIAAASGTVSFAGNLAGRGVLVISHGELRTTYEPVTPKVKAGEAVAAGQLAAELDDGHPCPGGACLHWGLKRGDEYLDPLSLLDNQSVRLLPAAAVQIAKRSAAARRDALRANRGIPGLLSMPASGSIGSGFGMRLHPIFNEWRMHEGVDIGGDCGNPIRAAANGTVERAAFDESGGNRLIINHGIVGGKQLRTIYLHAQNYQVRTGDKVLRGQVVGKVGSTGWSTGCHLHFSVTLNQHHADPAGFL